MLNIGIFGASGRIGKILVDLISNDQKHFNLVAVYVRKELNFNIPAGAMITEDLKVLLECSDVIIDFTSPEATIELLGVAANSIPKPIVIGTTGLDAKQEDAIRKASLKMPILYASNMSLGVAILKRVSTMVANLLEDFDIEIVETHHKHKKDSPSGTALTLAKACAKARDWNIEEVRISGRDGNIGAREKKEIGVMSLRGGNVVGEHSVGFYGEDEFLRLTHTATSRSTFARGALKAAAWLSKQTNGLYGIENALGIE